LSGSHGGDGVVVVVVEEHDGSSGFFLQSTLGVCPPSPSPDGTQFGSLLLLSQFKVVGPPPPPPVPVPPLLTQSLALVSQLSGLLVVGPLVGGGVSFVSVFLVVSPSVVAVDGVVGHLVLYKRLS
jgi:hypothetical protein